MSFHVMRNFLDIEFSFRLFIIMGIELTVKDKM